MSLADLPRQSILNDRHRANGGDLESVSWNNMPLPQTYATDPYVEVEAVRCRAGLFDVSSLQLLNVSGPDATKLLNYVLTSDISKAKPGDSHISNIVNENGGLIDDVLIYVDSPTEYRLSHGAGKLEEVIRAHAPKYDVKVERDDDVHVLALQGPLSLEILAPHTPMDLAGLGYFKHEPTTLFGTPVRIARGGYSAELGYEVFCAAKDAHKMWDSILAAGKDKGLIPVSWACLDIVRVEGGLLFFPCEMTNEDTTPWEVRADWTVDLSKPDFIGKKALVEKKGKERNFVAGLEIDHTQAIAPGSKITAKGKQVGVITSTTYSKHLMKSIALAQIEPAYTKLGTELVVHDGGDWPATVVRMPFYDPLRLRTHPRDKA